ncbi:hypothetical protein BH10ACI1_BH10ACI1_12300 [soil metagenome]
MKKIITILLSLTILFTAGCDYTTFLSENQGLPLDDNILGTWKYGKDEDKTFIIISKYSESEYAVRMFEKGEEKEIRFLGYPIKIGNFYCIQIILQLKDNPKQKYMVITYEVSDNKLIVKKLNTRLLGVDAKTSSDLKKLFFKYKDSPKLFTDLQIYERVKTTNPVTSTKPAVIKRN